MRAVVALVTILLSVLPSMVNDVTFDPGSYSRGPLAPGGGGGGSEVAHAHL